MSRRKHIVNHMYDIDIDEFWLDVPIENIPDVVMSWPRGKLYNVSDPDHYIFKSSHLTTPCENPNCCRRIMKVCYCCNYEYYIWGLRCCTACLTVLKLGKQKPCCSCKSVDPTNIYAKDGRCQRCVRNNSRRYSTIKCDMFRFQCDS
jgi:hypothetical protein